MSLGPLSSGGAVICSARCVGVPPGPKFGPRVVGIDRPGSGPRLKPASLNRRLWSLGLQPPPCKLPGISPKAMAAAEGGKGRAAGLPVVPDPSQWLPDAERNSHPLMLP